MTGLERAVEKGIPADNISISRVVYSLIIINKAGGLVYQREFQSGLLRLSTNDYLVLAGTFHGYAETLVSPEESTERQI